MPSKPCSRRECPHPITATERRLARRQYCSHICANTVQAQQRGRDHFVTIGRKGGIHGKPGMVHSPEWQAGYSAGYSAKRRAEKGQAA